MADHTAEIAALKKAIASGVKRVVHNGVDVEYVDFESLIARLNWLEKLDSESTGAQAGLASFDRGDC